MNIKYIYYEKYAIYNSDGKEVVKEKIQNINALLIKPNTNSSGIWGYRNVTEHKGKNEFVLLEQIWIDLEKYKFGKQIYLKSDNNIYKCLEYINIKIRKEKLNKINEKFSNR
jgi:hypothetical protein